MNRALIVAGTVLIIVIAVLLVIAWFRRQHTKDKARERGWALNGDLTKAQEDTLIQELRDARKLCLDILTLPQDLYSTDMSLLSRKHREGIVQWLSHSEATLKKLENGA